MSEPGLPCVSVIFTGGTISMEFDAASGGAVPRLSGAEILARVPDLDRVARVRSLDFGRYPGPHVTPERMLELAGRLGRELSDPGVDGVVVTHGTDTLEETAYLLDLVLPAGKPVVLFGAMRPSSDPAWDGPANLRSALRVAVAPASRGQGVLVVMGDQVLPGAEAVKSHTEALDAFRARDFGPLGWVDKDRVVFARRRSGGEHHAGARLETRVEVISLPAGCDGRLIRLALESGTRGLVLEAMGRGNIPVSAVPEVERALAAGVPVVITTRCSRGRVLDTYAYEGGGRRLTQQGAILGGWLPAHKARLKLMLLLGAGRGLAEIRAAFGEEEGS